MQLLLGNRDLLKCIYNTSRNEMSLGTLRRFIVMSAPHCANDQLQNQFFACVLLPHSQQLDVGWRHPTGSP